MLKKKGEVIKSDIKIPIEGKVIPLDLVPDMIFKNKIMGDGFAIIPEDEYLKSPCNGTIKQIVKNKRIVIISTDDGFDILIHLGIDSREVLSSTIDVFVSEGEKVKIGDKILKFSLEELRNKSKSITTPIIFTNLKEDQYIYYDKKNKLIKLKPMKIYICKD